MLRQKGRVWVFLRSGNVLHFDFDEAAGAEKFEEELHQQLGARRIEVEPHPTLGTTVLVLLTMCSSCAFMSVVSPLLTGHFFAALAVLSTATAAAAALSAAMRGVALAVGHDGIRLGKIFVSFDKIDTVHFEDGRVIIIDVDGQKVSKRVRLPKALASALSEQVMLRRESVNASDGFFERKREEAVHDWLQRIRTSIRKSGFREPAIERERVRVAALHPKSPLRVRVAALAGLMEAEPELAQELLEVSADPRLAKAAKAAQGSAEGWRRVVEKLEREGALD